MASNEREDWGVAIVCTIATVAAVTWLAVGGGKDPQPAVTPSATASVAPSTPGPVASRTVAPGVLELPDCEYRLPPCVRREGTTWFLINDYQGDRRPVTIVATIIRGDVVFRMVREG